MEKIKLLLVILGLFLSLNLYADDAINTSTRKENNILDGIMIGITLGITITSSICFLIRRRREREGIKM